MAPRSLLTTFKSKCLRFHRIRRASLLTTTSQRMVCFPFSHICVGKSKRRSKNDVDGRDFKCKYCDKTYLSYPALYTHMKQKHSKGPDGEVRTPPTSGRGRGRPRKNVSMNSPDLIFSLTREPTQKVMSTLMHPRERGQVLIP